MSGSMSGMWKRSYGEVLGHRQPKGAATDKPTLLPPRHISTLPILLKYSARIEASGCLIVWRWLFVGFEMGR